MSMPGQKPRPAPVITTACSTSGSSSARSASSKNAACIGHVHAFIRSGRFSVIVATPSATAPEHVGVVVAVGHRGTVCSCLASRATRRAGRLEIGSQVSWDFSTEPEFQEKLDWVEQFCREQIDPVDLALS